MTEEEIKENILPSVSYDKDKRKKRWRTYVYVERKTKSLGYYYTEEEARDVCREYRLNLLKESAKLPLSECKLYKGYFVFPNGQVFKPTCIENHPSKHKSTSYMTIRINNKYERLHRVLALCFIPNDDVEGKPYINHINGIRDDNRLENLEWCSPKENSIHARDVLGKAGGSQKLTREEVKEIKILISKGYKDKEIAKMYNITPSNISAIRHGKSWKEVKIDE